MSYVVHVHVGDKIVAVACGNATQRVKWLANVGVARFDELKFQGWDEIGTAKAVQKGDGTPIEMAAIIKDVIASGDHIIVSTSMGNKSP